jgi:hypothetical protein
MGCCVGRNSIGDMEAMYYCPSELCPACGAHMQATHHPACNGSGYGTFTFTAYGYEVVIQPYHELGQWLAEIDGVNHSYEDWSVHPSADDAICERLRLCRLNAALYPGGDEQVVNPDNAPF